jgi:hypothetical protein
LCPFCCINKILASQVDEEEGEEGEDGDVIEPIPLQPEEYM